MAGLPAMHYQLGFRNGSRVPVHTPGNLEQSFLANTANTRDSQTSKQTNKPIVILYIFIQQEDFYSLLVLL